MKEPRGSIPPGRSNKNPNMTVLELKQILENMPDELEVIMYAPYDGDYEINEVRLDALKEPYVVRIYS